jgi:putative ABC transport system permease protein
MQTLWHDLRYGARMLFKSKGFTAVAVLALALGIGANTAIFSVVNAVILRPLPFAEQERLIVVWKQDQTASNPFVELSVPEFVDWQKQSTVFESVAAMPTTVYGYGYVLSERGGEEPSQIESARVSASFFPTLGVKAALGRAFVAEEDRPGAARVVVLNHRFWQSRFNADPNLVGQTLTLNGANYTVTGIMPPEFDFPKGVDVWTPLQTNARQSESRATVFLQAVGRLKPGVTIERARAELNAITGRLAAQYPEMNASNQKVVITPLAEYVFGNARPALYLLLAASVLLLLIACANIANLLLARATVRRKEIAVRAALGASRARLVRQLLTESFALAGMGGALGVLLADWLVALFKVFAPADIPRIEDVHINGAVLGFTCVVTLLTALVFGLAPALTISKIDLNESLKEGGAKGADDRSGNRLRGALIVAEVSVTLVLLVSAGLILHSFMNLRQAGLGFDPRNVLTAHLKLQGAKYAEPRQSRDFYARLLERLEAQPGVVAAGAILIRPLEGTIGWDVPYMIEGQTPDEAKRNIVPNYEVITPHYFRSMSIPLLKGREFTEQDREQAPNVAIISETMARRIFLPGTDPLGQRIKLDPSDPETAWRTIVGVVGDARYRELKDIRWDVYVPYRQTTDPIRYITIRTASDPQAFISIVRREVAAIDSGQAVTGVATMEQLVATSLARPRFNTLLLSLFAFLAITLASIGLYGVISYSVTRRTREIGIRIALGAQTRDVLKLVVKQGMTPVLVGVVIGVAAALVVTRVMSSLLFGVSATDPATFIGVSVLLTGVALLACFVPARRATKVDPMVTLRHE